MSHYSTLTAGASATAFMSMRIDVPKPLADAFLDVAEPMGEGSWYTSAPFAMLQHREPESQLRLCRGTLKMFRRLRNGGDKYAPPCAIELAMPMLLDPMVPENYDRETRAVIDKVGAECWMTTAVALFAWASPEARGEANEGIDRFLFERANGITMHDVIEDVLTQLEASDPAQEEDPDDGDELRRVCSELGFLNTRNSSPAAMAEQLRRVWAWYDERLCPALERGELPQAS